MLWVSEKHLETICIVTDAIQIKLIWIELKWLPDVSRLGCISNLLQSKWKKNKRKRAIIIAFERMLTSFLSTNSYILGIIFIRLAKIILLWRKHNQAMHSLISICAYETLYIKFTVFWHCLHVLHLAANQHLHSSRALSLSHTHMHIYLPHPIHLWHMWGKLLRQIDAPHVTEQPDSLPAAHIV